MKLIDIIQEEIENLYNVPYDDFDKVWRKMNYSNAIKYMNEYLKQNRKNLEDYQIGALLWHIGQIYAMQNDYGNAIKYMSMPEISHSIEPNYQMGTIAFLKNDLNGLKNYYNALRKNDLSGGNNLTILKNFIDNPNKQYKDAY